MSTGAIIGVIVVIFVIKLALIFFIIHKRNQKRAERRAKGCTCFGNTEYYCLPWWYWMSDSHCKCGALSNPRPVPNGQAVPNAPPAYTSQPGLEPVQPTNQGTQMGANSWGQNPTQMGPNSWGQSPTQMGPNSWSQNPTPMEYKPPQQIHVNQRYYEGV